MYHIIEHKYDNPLEYKKFSSIKAIKDYVKKQFKDFYNDPDEDDITYMLETNFCFLESDSKGKVVQLFPNVIVPEIQIDFELVK